MANNTTARNRQDVDSMDVRDRLWDSLNYSYGVKRENSDKSFDQAYSQADRQALSRGMQRSSYNNQTLANIANQKVEAQNAIYNEQIADYENRLYQIERDEEADRQWQASFDEGVRQYDTTMQYNKERAAAQDAQWQKSFDEGVRQFDVGQGNTDRQFAYNYVMAMLQNGQMPSADLLAKAGLSAADAQRMMTQGVVATGSSGSGNRNPNTNGGLDLERVLKNMSLNAPAQNSADLISERYNKKVPQSNNTNTKVFSGGKYLNMTK